MVVTSSKHIRIITTGGTIASLPNENGDVLATLSGQDLVDQLGVIGNIQVTSSVTIGSFAFDYDTLVTVAEDVLEALNDPGVAGVVVTHGTDTLEETAFYLSLVTAPIKKPVIVTGAQLDASYLFSDGIKNLQDAIYAAQSDRLANFGTLVSFAGFLYPARDVRKVDTSALEGFESPSWGPVGRIDNQEVILQREVHPQFSLEPVIPEPVALIRLGIGMTGSEISRMAEGYAGVVIQAFGRGNSHPSIPAEIKQLTDQGIPVIITSRCLSGSVLPVYGNGGGKDLERAGAWFAGDLAGEKARILLGTMLSAKKTWDEMKDAFEKMSNF